MARATKHPRAKPAHGAAERARTEALFRSIGEGAIVTDEEGRISRVNPVAVQLLGFDESELVGHWYPDTLIAEDAEGSRIRSRDRPIMRAILSGKPVHARMFFRRKDGTRLAVAVTVSPLIMDERPIGAVEVFRDITAELESEKVKDDFISIASHQLRTPATSVKQYIGMILEGFAGEIPAHLKPLLQQTYESNERQLNIINDLLRVAHIDSGKAKLNQRSVDLVSLVDEVASELKPGLEEKSLRLTVEHERETVFVTVDPDRFRMVIENIIDNARKYTPEGKRVHVLVGQDAGRARVVVRDEGVGINSHDFDKLFQRFSRIDNPLSHTASSTGLGLYWAKRVVDLHGGSIEVESEVGEGTTFVITLPLTKPGKSL